MAIWWVSEAVPLAVTALVPLVLFPLLGVSKLETVAHSYSHPLIFLFLGGFLLAKAMERWRLHQRIASWIMRLGGDEPGSIIAGLMAATAFLSMWLSNTASAMVMLPIGQAIVAVLREDGDAATTERARDTPAAVMLAIAYSATIGGMATAARRSG
jgi:sodium-dependent dicarboxylate transporter 2/3/5